MSAVVTMMFNNSEYVPFRVFNDGTAKFTINNTVRQINDFGAWFLSAVNRGWKKVAECNIPEDTFLEATSAREEYHLRRDEFRHQWLEFEEENIDNWGI